MTRKTRLCSTPDSASVLTGRVFTANQVLKARFEVNDFERVWNSGRDLPKTWLFELFYARRGSR